MAFLRRLINRNIKTAPTQPEPPDLETLDVTKAPEPAATKDIDDTLEIKIQPQEIEITTPDSDIPSIPRPKLSHKLDKSIYEVGYFTHVGRVRKRNEDSALVLTTTSLGESSLAAFGLYIVADGMGGHSDGQKASQLAIRIVAQQVMNHIYPPYLSIDNHEPSQPVQDILGDAVQKANWQVFEANSESGTTLTAILLVGNRLYAAHVGDSRAYMIKSASEKAELLTLDHSFVQRLQDAGQITAEEASVHPQRNILYRAVGQGEKLEIDTFSKSLTESCYLLICSDGLWGQVPIQIIQQTVLSAPTSQTACEQLVEFAIQAGGPDNITVIIIKYQAPNPARKD